VVAELSVSGSCCLDDVFVYFTGTDVRQKKGGYVRNPLPQFMIFEAKWQKVKNQR
jgi:hypothetical protein